MQIRSYPLPLRIKIQSVDSFRAQFCTLNNFQVFAIAYEKLTNPKHIANDVAERSERQSTFYAVSRFNWHVFVYVCVRAISSTTVGVNEYIHQVNSFNTCSNSALCCFVAFVFLFRLSQISFVRLHCVLMRWLFPLYSL